MSLSLPSASVLMSLSLHLCLSVEVPPFLRLCPFMFLSLPLCFPLSICICIPLHFCLCLYTSLYPPLSYPTVSCFICPSLSPPYLSLIRLISLGVALLSLPPYLMTLFIHRKSYCLCALNLNSTHISFHRKSKFHLSAKIRQNILQKRQCWLYYN